MKHNREITEIQDQYGSMVMVINCKTLQGLDDLWLQIDSAKLRKKFESVFLTEDFKVKHNVKAVTFTLAFDEDEYYKYREILSGCLTWDIVNAKTKSVSACSN